jgi:hypothetical protein
MRNSERGITVWQFRIRIPNSAFELAKPSRCGKLRRAQGMHRPAGRLRRACRRYRAAARAANTPSTRRKSGRNACAAGSGCARLPLRILSRRF